MAVTPAALKSELLNDPAHYGYAGVSNNDQLAAMLIVVNQTTLTTALTNGQTGIVSLAVAALPFAINASGTVTLISGGTSQVVTLSANAPAGATSLTVTSFTASAAYPVGSPIYREPMATTYVSTDQLQNAVVESEYIALTAAVQNLWLAILLAGGGSQNVSSAGIRAQIGAIWGAGTTTRANLLQLQTRGGSRAETLFGAGAAVTGIDVGVALSS